MLTFFAFVVLVLRPELLANGVGVEIDRSAYFMGYMLGAAEWGLAAMTFFGRWLSDAQALRAISAACIVFHMTTAAVLIATFFSGGSSSPLGLWANVFVPRFGISAACAYFGLYGLRPMPAGAQHIICGDRKDGPNATE